MGLGMDAVGANKFVDYDTAYLLADELGIVAEKEEESYEENITYFGCRSIRRPCL